jgi:hypothetical protein
MINILPADTYTVINRTILTENDRKVMIRDIETSDYYGDECDDKCWRTLLSRLKRSNSTGLEE